MLEVRVHRPELKHKRAILIAGHNLLGKAPQFHDDNFVDSRNYKQRQVREKKTKNSETFMWNHVSYGITYHNKSHHLPQSDATRS